MTELPEPVSVEEWGESDERAPAASEEEIVSGLKQGDPQAWTALYDRYSVRVWRYVARLTGGESQAVADVVQETMLAAAESAAGFDDSKGTLAGWLMGIAHHRASNFWRERQRARRIVTKLQTDSPATEFESNNAPDARMQLQELADVVRFVLAELPPDYSALLTAKYIDECSIIEIQEQTGGTSDAVRSKLVRARREFREVYERVSDERSL